jgi:lon-related putative ATP-dependent protease
MVELTAEQIRKVTPIAMTCETTEELAPLQQIVGQKRAIRALQFGLGIQKKGFNVYAAGQPGTGKTTAVTRFLRELAAAQAVPGDWCYVNNFKDTYRPRAIKLPKGRGTAFVDDVTRFIDEVRAAIPRAFESEEYAQRRDTTLQSIQTERNAILAALKKRTDQAGFVIQTSPIGLLLLPVVGGRPLNDQQFMALDPRLRKEIEGRRDALRGEVGKTMRRIRGLERKAAEDVRQLNQDVALYAIEALVGDLAESYADLDEVREYLDEVKGDIVSHVDQFLGKQQPQPQQLALPWMRDMPFRKYQVNLIVDNAELDGAPVVTEPNPTYLNLFGRVEKEALFGALTTDFTMIRGGSLHRANGGYLVIPVVGLFRDPLAYESLKRALQHSCIRIEEAGERLGFLSTKSLRPEPIPLTVKVVVIGDPRVYRQLYAMDPEFSELFKVKADFDTTIDRTAENMRTYAAFVCALCRKEELKHLDTAALDTLIENSARMAGHQDKLSTRFGDVADILREASYYATEDDAPFVTADHIRRAVEERLYRSNLIEEKLREMIVRGAILIDTARDVVGQVNGLSVMGLGDVAFGSPSRVTASIALGRAGLVDIQREAKLGGPIHTKGVMILGGYLADKFAQDKPLSLSARLVFEQSYGMVEGDSASSTELYAILSALSELPLKQCIAVTGSVNQKGEVQAIGGVNEKIEGFFEVCKLNGLTGRQGVMIPASNVQNLMLKEAVVDAVRAGQFHLYAVATIDEGIELLTGVPAGARTDDGDFEADTVYHRVNQRLRDLATRLKAFAVEKPDRPDDEA